MHFDPDDVFYALCGSRFAIEYASDGTSVCTGACSEIIPTGCIRLGASNELDNSGTYAWRCVDCLTRDLLEEVRNLYTFTYLCPGMDHLGVHDREYVVEATEDVLYPREDVLAVDPAISLASPTPEKFLGFSAVSLASPTPEKSASKIQVQPQSSPRIPLKTYNLRTRHGRINTYESPTSQDFASDSSSDYEAYTRTTDVTGHPKHAGGSDARMTRFIKHTPRKVNNKMRSHSTGRRSHARHNQSDSADELFIEPQRYQWSRSKRRKYKDESRDNLSMPKQATAPPHMGDRGTRTGCMAIDNKDNDNGDRGHWRTRSTTQVQMIEQDRDTANALQQTMGSLHRDSGHHKARDVTAGEAQNNSSIGGLTNSRSERMHQFMSFYMHNANNALLTAATSKTNHRPHSGTPGKARTKTLPTDDSAHKQAGKRSQKTTRATHHHEGSRTHYNTCTQSYSSGDLWQPNSTAGDSVESLAPQHNTQQHTKHPTAAHGHRHRSRTAQQQIIHTGTRNTPHTMHTSSPKRLSHKHPTTETHTATAVHAQAMGTAVDGRPSGALRTTGESPDVSQGSDNSHDADDNHATVDSRVLGFYTRQDSEQRHRGMLQGNHIMGTTPTAQAVDKKPKESANLAWDFDKMTARAEKLKLHLAKVCRRRDLDGNHNEGRSTQPHRRSTQPHNRSTQPHNPVRVHVFVHTPNSSPSKPATNTVARQPGNAETITCTHEPHHNAHITSNE